MLRIEGFDQCRLCTKLVSRSEMSARRPAAPLHNRCYGTVLVNTEPGISIVQAVEALVIAHNNSTARVFAAVHRLGKPWNNGTVLGVPIKRSEKAGYRGYKRRISARSRVV